MMRIAFALTVFAAMNSSSTAAESIDGCLPITIGDVASFDVPRFEQYPAIEAFRGAPAKVDLASHPKARRYRTMLGRQAGGGADFAGHFTVAGWGCGTSCLQKSFTYCSWHAERRRSA